MIVHVTQKHIDDGIKNSTIENPVALAIIDHFTIHNLPKVKKIEVVNGVIQILSDYNYLVGQAPNKIHQFLLDHETKDTKLLKPFSFRMNLIKVNLLYENSRLFYKELWEYSVKPLLVAKYRGQ